MQGELHKEGDVEVPRRRGDVGVPHKEGDVVGAS
jgi:hypothetical protein